MRIFLIVILAMLSSSGTVYAQNKQEHDPFKGSFSMYNISTEMVVIKKIESQTDPNTEKVMIGGLALRFEYLDHGLNEVNGMQVASVHFSDKDDKYILDYYVGGNNVVKIMLFSKNGEYVSKELYPEKADRNCGEEKSGK